jgi:TonB family protein
MRTLLALTLLVPVLAWGQSRLPPCPQSPSAFSSLSGLRWHNCIGEVISSNGQKYVGEFRNGKENGKGMYTFPNGEKYIGEWRNGKRHGQGIEYRTDGTVQRSGHWESGSFVQLHAPGIREKLKLDEEKKKSEAGKVAEEKAKRDAERKTREAEDEKLAERLRAETIAKMRQQIPDSRPRQDVGSAEQGLTSIVTPSGARADDVNQAGQASGMGATGSSADVGYAARIRSAIRANTVFNASGVPGNPQARFRVTLSPSCEVLQVRLEASSENKAWDEAAERAIARTSPFPRPPSGPCDRSLEISHRPREVVL